MSTASMDLYYWRFSYASANTVKLKEEKEKLIKNYEKSKLHEVSVYISTVMRKNQHKNSIKFAYNFE
jgi:hypothetical protein